MDLKKKTKNQDPYTCCLKEIHFRHKNTQRLKDKIWKKIFLVNGNQKKAGVAILISDKIDFKDYNKRKKKGITF